MKFILPLIATGQFLASAIQAQDEKDTSSALVYEQRFEKRDDFVLQGDATVVDLRLLEIENGAQAVALNSATKGSNIATCAVQMEIKGLTTEAGEWLRFSFAAMPQRNFSVKGDEDLVMKVKYFGKSGTESLDGVVKEIYPAIQADREDIARNGFGFRDGAVAWPRHAFDFRIPFNGIDTLRISINVQNGTGRGAETSLLVDEIRVERVATPTPSSAYTTEARKSSATIEAAKLLPLGGKWFYLPRQNEKTAPTHFDSWNLDRLVYKTGQTIETPFAMARGTWLRKGNKDAFGRIMQEDRWVENSVQIDFSAKALMITTVNLPNHSTGIFPGYLRNPNFIQEKELTFTIPLDPQPNQAAKAMNYKNLNNALPKGPIGLAVNGVIFYNPFDVGTEEAVNMMDRCCGHPDPGNFYHYHKYPVCARSPFEDAGHKHSPLIGWAFDGFPVYGPYEGNGEMAMDCKKNPLNEFNIHRDQDRGWHYHVSPGKFPYIIGGFWGQVVQGNMLRPPPMGAPGGPGGGFPPPPHSRGPRM